MGRDNAWGNVKKCKEVLRLVDNCKDWFTKLQTINLARKEE